MALDSTILSGGNDIDSSDNVSVPNVPAQDTSAPPAPPDLPAQGPQDQTPTQTMAPITSPTKPTRPLDQSPWAQIALGALQGLAKGSQVRGPRSGGAAFGAGVGGALEAQDQADAQAKTDQYRAQQLQFQSLEAANNAVKTRLDVARAAQLDEEAKIKLDDHAVSVNNAQIAAGLPAPYILNSRSGHYALGDNADGQDTPNSTPLSAQASSALDVSAKAQPDGKIPVHAAVVSPHSDASPGAQVGIMTTSPGQVTAKPAPYNDIINESNRYDAPGSADLTPAQILAQGAAINKDNPAAGVATLATRARQNLFNSILPTGDLAKDQATSASLHTQLENYKQSAQALLNDNSPTNSKRDAIVDALQKRVDAFDASMSSAQQATAKANADAAAKKAQSEELAKNTGAAGQSQVALAGAKSGAEAKAKAQYDDNLVVAYDPSYQNADGSKGGNVVLPRGQAATQGLQHYKADPSTINSTVGGFNDVQQKVDRLAAIATDPTKMSQVQHGIAADLIKGADKGIKVGAFGMEIDTSNPNAQAYASQLAKANQATRDFVTATINAHEAMTQLPRLQTFGKSNRMTQQQMEAAQNLLPNAGDDAGMAQQKITAVQDILDPLRKQIPHMQGAELSPTWRDKQQGQPQAQSGATHVYDPQTKTVKPLMQRILAPVTNWGGNQ
jgi:hypothetical protein